MTRRLDLVELYVDKATAERVMMAARAIEAFEYEHPPSMGGKWPARDIRDIMAEFAGAALKVAAEDHAEILAEVDMSADERAEREATRAMRGLSDRAMERLLVMARDRRPAR